MLVYFLCKLDFLTCYHYIREWQSFYSAQRNRMFWILKHAFKNFFCIRWFAYWILTPPATLTLAMLTLVDDIQCFPTHKAQLNKEELKKIFFQLPWWQALNKAFTWQKYKGKKVIDSKSKYGHTKSQISKSLNL